MMVSDGCWLPIYPLSVWGTCLQVLDPALLRAGRFDQRIEFQLPDKSGREEPHAAACRPYLGPKETPKKSRKGRQKSMPNMTGRPGHLTMEINGGSSASSRGSHAKGHCPRKSLGDPADPAKPRRAAEPSKRGHRRGLKSPCPM